MTDDTTTSDGRIDAKTDEFADFQQHELTAESFLHRVKALMTGGQYSAAGDCLQALSTFGDGAVPGVRSSDTKIEVAVDPDNKRVAIAQDLMWASHENQNVEGRGEDEVKELVDTISEYGRDAKAHWQGDFTVLEVEPFVFESESQLADLLRSVIFIVLFLERLDGRLTNIQ